MLREKKKKRWNRPDEEAVYTASHEYSNGAARHQVSGFISMRCQPVGFPGLCSIVAPERPFINHRERREIPVSRGRATGTGLVNSTSYRDKVPAIGYIVSNVFLGNHMIFDYHASVIEQLQGSARWVLFVFRRLVIVNEKHCRSGLSWLNSVRLNCTRFARIIWFMLCEPFHFTTDLNNIG